MLYELAPPLLLFASFGGMIIVVSRVMLRIRRQQFSHEVRETAGAVKQSDAEQNVLQAGESSVQLVKNRLSLFPQILKRSATSTREMIGERKVKSAKRKEERQKAKEQRIQEKEALEKVREGRAITEPESSWRNRLSETISTSKNRVSAAKSSIAETIPKRVALRKKKQVEKEAPIQKHNAEEVEQASEKRSPVRLIRTSKPEPAEEAPEPSALSKLMKKDRSKEEKLSPIEAAEDAIANAKYQIAEDALISHIVNHTTDARAYMLLGKVAVAKEEWNEAVEIFQQVLEINDENAAARAELGCAALQAGKMTLALENLQRAHDENPSNEKVLKSLLMIANRMDNAVLRESVTQDLTMLKASEDKAEEPA